MSLCLCGCGREVIQKSKYYSSVYILGHNNRGKFIKNSQGFQKGNSGFWLGKKRYGFKGSWVKGHVPWNKGPKIDRKKYPNMCAFGRKRSLESIERMKISNRGKRKKGGKGLHGALNPAWKGGVTTQNKLDRVRFQKTIQKDVFKRDNYACQICSVVGQLQVDHIKPWVDFKELRFDINNCRTLCSKCHYKITFGKDMPEGIQSWGHNLIAMKKRRNIK